MAQTSSFRIGDVVTSPAGERLMTVVARLTGSAGDVECAWFEGVSRKSARFSPEQLDLVLPFDEHLGRPVGYGI